MATEMKTILETNNFIVLDKYVNYGDRGDVRSEYQTEAELEAEFIDDLIRQGYEKFEGRNYEDMLKNVRFQLELLNDMRFSDKEWERFVIEFLDKQGDNIIEKTRKIQDNYICDFVFDDGHIKNIYLVDKKDISRNKVQVMSQFRQKGVRNNRYDVTVLVNGLPLVQVELKRRGIKIKEAFNQIHRYSKESYNVENSLFKYIQIFVISNGTDTRYFANTLSRDQKSYDFTMNWAKKDNKRIKDLKDFTETFFAKNTVLNVLLTYSVFDVSNNLLIMRPYQISAAERIIWKIKSSHNAKKWSDVNGGGYIWHTTGSGKTLTSYKTARLATELDFIKKVFFVVDRKDLDYQTMKEYQRFSPDSVNGSNNTAGLKKNIEKEDNRIVVTTIQKLNKLMKSEKNLAIYNEEVVFIFDEAHRSQFGEAQENLKKYFKKYYQFGFTGTPIFAENAIKARTTADVFGEQLHSYIITDAIRDEKVLKFKVDYNTMRVLPKDVIFLETETDEEKINTVQSRKMMRHPERIKGICEYILRNYRHKTGRLYGDDKGFNAMFAVDSVEAAKAYYIEFKKMQEVAEKPLKIATIFSYAANEEQDAVGDIADEATDTENMDVTAKEFLASVINDYNAMFGTSWGVDGGSFEDYYKDLAKRVKDREVDLLIVVGMFLTGFDAKRLNTLFVDKNLRYHGLIQAFSRTNRILDSTKTFGNIVTFRDLEEATNDALALFGEENTKAMIIEKPYKEQMNGSEEVMGYKEIVKKLKEKFPNPSEIEREDAKIEFVKLFGEYLKIENKLRNYDEYILVREYQKIDKGDEKAIEDFMRENNLTEEKMEEVKSVDVLSERQEQDYRSVYNDIREWKKGEDDVREGGGDERWEDVVFEVELLKYQEINLDYILDLIFEYKKKKNKKAILEDISRVIKSSAENRAKEVLVTEFVESFDLDKVENKEELFEAFFDYAEKRRDGEIERLIEEENLHGENARRYIARSLKNGYASDLGVDFDETLPVMGRLTQAAARREKRDRVFGAMCDLVERYKGIGRDEKRLY